jgi:hypothetical protein
MTDHPKTALVIAIPREPGPARTAACTAAALIAPHVSRIVAASRADQQMRDVAEELGSLAAQCRDWLANEGRTASDEQHLAFRARLVARLCELMASILQPGDQT